MGAFRTGDCGVTTDRQRAPAEQKDRLAVIPTSVMVHGFSLLSSTEAVLPEGQVNPRVSTPTNSFVTHTQETLGFPLFSIAEFYRHERQFL